VPKQHKPLDPGLHYLKLTEGVPGHIAGDVIRVDNFSADSLIRRGLAEVYDPNKGEPVVTTAAQAPRAGVVTTTVAALGVNELPSEAELAELMRQAEKDLPDLANESEDSSPAAPDAQSVSGGTSGSSTGSKPR
jgi:hypothetical protein